MADRIGFKVTGLNEKVRALQALGLEVEDLKEAFGTLAARGARMVTSFTPKRSGRLARSTRGNRAKNKAVVAQGGRGVDYAGVSNYGWSTRGIRAAHQLQRADDRLRPLAVDLVNAEIDKAIAQKGLS